MAGDVTKACYNCLGYRKTKGIDGTLTTTWRCIVDDVDRTRNTPCVYLGKFRYNESKLWQK